MCKGKCATLSLVYLVGAVAVALLAAATLSHAATRPDIDAEFAAFLAKFGKTYASEEERLHRKGIFGLNLARAGVLQRQDRGSATYGVTKFSDLTPEEFRQHFLGMAPSSKAQIRSLPVLEVPTAPRIPTSIDYRTKGAITPVKNQLQCGSCWAFSTTEQVESMAFQATGKLPVLAPQELVDCVTTDYGCNGGLPSDAMTWLMTKGMEQESDYPYTASTDDCKFNANKVVTRLANWTQLPEEKWQQMQTYVGTTGPLSVALQAEWLQHYTGGVADPLFCSHQLDHAVQVAGYDKTSTPYWLVRNSWGADWGEQGYFRLVSGKNKCGIEEVPVTCVVRNS